MTIQQEINNLTAENYVELFEVDTTVIGGSDIFRFIPDAYSSTNVTWRGDVYTQFPVQITGFQWDGSGAAPPQPTLTVSNVNKFMLAAVISLGDITGARVKRWRTFQKFLDGQPDANPNAYITEDTYYVYQKTIHNKAIIEFKLNAAIDKPGLKLPRRQILKDETEGNLYAPGVSNVRPR